MKLIIGLGNPLPDYANTWHNLGTLYVQQARQILEKIDASLTCHETRGIKICIFKNPQLALAHSVDIYMNHSFKLVNTALKQVRAAKEIFIAHDDISFNKTTVKVTPKPNKKHKGVLSILQHRPFPKPYSVYYIRLGIPYTQANPKRVPLRDFILQKISPELLVEYKLLFTEHFKSNFVKK